MEKLFFLLTNVLQMLSHHLVYDFIQVTVEYRFLKKPVPTCLYAKIMILQGFMVEDFAFS